MWTVVYTKNFLLQFVRQDPKMQSQVMEWVSFIFKVIDGDDVDYDIIDEYEEPEQKEPSPINYHVDYDEERLYVISLTDKIAKAGRRSVR